MSPSPGWVNTHRTFMNTFARKVTMMIIADIPGMMGSYRIFGSESVRAEIAAHWPLP